MKQGIRRSGLLALALATALALAAACGGDDRNNDDATPEPSTTAAATAAPLAGDITVFAAASLTAAFQEAGKAFESANPGASVTFNFAGSPALRTQLEQGASAEVLATADEKNMAAALDKKLVVDAGRTFARNRLVIAVPAANPAEIAEPADLAKDGIKLVLAQEDVPVGAYARESLGKMEADAAFGAGFRDRVLANVVSNEPNVKAVVTKVQLGEADAGIVYTTDITADLANEVRSIEIPAQFNVIATYPIAVTSTAEGAKGRLATAFIEYLLSDDGQAILQKHGFVSAE